MKLVQVTKTPRSQIIPVETLEIIEVDGEEIEVFTREEKEVTTYISSVTTGVEITDSFRLVEDSNPLPAWKAPKGQKYRLPFVPSGSPDLEVDDTGKVTEIQKRVEPVVEPVVELEEIRGGRLK